MPKRKLRTDRARILLAASLLLLSLGCERVEGIRIGVNYTAKGLCSCLFVMERALDRCYADMLGPVDQIPVEIDAEARRVRASLFGLFEGDALYEDGRGCILR
jgi:hypothetical protein